MKNRVGILFGLTALLFMAGKIILVKNNNDRSNPQEKSSTEAKYEVRTDSNKIEVIGAEERKPKHNSTYQQLPTNPNMPDTNLNQKELGVMADLDVLVHDQFAPMTDWGRDVRLNPTTKEVAIVFSSAGKDGERIIGSIWPMGTMEKQKGKYNFKPLKWKKEHEEFDTLKEYLLTHIDYIDSQGEIRHGNLKAFWDWRLIHERPFFFAEE